MHVYVSDTKIRAVRDCVRAG